MDTLSSSKTVPHGQNFYPVIMLYNITVRTLDFIERISHFIPYPHRHRRHYHGVLAPNSPLRKQLVTNAQKRLEKKAKAMQQTVEKVTKASRSWAQLISRIYEVDPLICLGCGKKSKS